MGNHSVTSWIVASLVAAGCSKSTGDFQVPPTPDAGPHVDAPPALHDASDGGLLDGADGGIDASNDHMNPVIALVAPASGALVAGVMRLDVDVTDADGVMAVTATIAGTHAIAMVHGVGVRWTGYYDTLPLAGLVAPTIVVRAVDAARSTAQLGFEVTLDNEPPIAALDPPDVRSAHIQGGVLQCSVNYDPLGPDAPNDGEAVPQLTELRARVVDLPNNGTVNTSLFIPYAGVASVKLYVLDDSAIPLVVDTDGDGICDDVNPHIVPAVIPMFSNEAAVITLAGVAPTGGAFFGPDTFGGSNGGGTCSMGMDMTPPANLCPGEAGTIAIGTAFDHLPEIFGIPPVDSSNCLGFAFDARATNISDGWACTAVLALDGLGNRSVSAPLRICVDSDGNQAECGAWGTIAPAGTRPSCTGTYDRLTDTVTSTACIPRGFFKGVANEDELVF